MFAIRENRDMVLVGDFERAVTKVLDIEEPKCTESGVMFA
jgi:ATP-dependent 26S proteasome regulatory subunit